MLELRGISLAFGGHRALEDVSISIAEGELVTVLGPSGSGKSTLLRVIAGLETPDTGSVAIAGREVTSAEPRDREVAMVFQSFALFPHMTVRDNIGFGLAARRTPSDEMTRRIDEVARRLGLEGRLESRPAELSGGERQRVALGRALVRRPRVLLLDEPLSNLDAALRVRARAEIKRLQTEDSLTAIYVTHDQAEALALGDRVALLADGRLVQQGTPQEVYDRPADAWVAGFLGDPPMNLLPGRIDDGVIRAGPIAVPAHGDRDGKEVLLGFRADDVRCGVAGGFDGVVVLEERVGHSRLWQVELEDRLIAVRPPAGLEMSVGDHVSLQLDPRAISLFDASDGTAL